MRFIFMSTVSQLVMNCILERGQFSVSSLSFQSVALLSENVLYPDEMLDVSGLDFIFSPTHYLTAPFYLACLRNSITQGLPGSDFRHLPSIFDWRLLMFFPSHYG
jgi:hypothetical protein